MYSCFCINMLRVFVCLAASISTLNILFSCHSYFLEHFGELQLEISQIIWTNKKLSNKLVIKASVCLLLTIKHFSWTVISRMLKIKMSEKNNENL